MKYERITMREFARVTGDKIYKRLSTLEDKIESRELVDRDEYLDRIADENTELRERLDKAIELPCKIGETIYTVIKNCVCCQHYNVRWAECNAPATANFDCTSIHEICFTRDIIDDESKKHLCVAGLKFDLGLLDPKTGKLLPHYFTDREAAEVRLIEIQKEVKI